MLCFDCQVPIAQRTVWCVLPPSLPLPHTHSHCQQTCVPHPTPHASTQAAGAAAGLTAGAKYAAGEAVQAAKETASQVRPELHCVGRGRRPIEFMIFIACSRKVLPDGAVV